MADRESAAGATEAGQPTETVVDDLLRALSPAERRFLAATSLVRLTTAARWLGVSSASLRRHVHEGDCSGRKFDGEWFVGRGAIVRWRLRHPSQPRR